MTKPKITEAKCFGEVAKVIGRNDAERELFIASQRRSTHFNHADKLEDAFWWDKSPQGRLFWISIHEGISPYEQ